MSDSKLIQCERSADYPFTDWDLHLEEAIKKLGGRPRHCGVNAFRCLRRAWALANVDPEMALFRAITAEEEAATALMVALKQQGYPGAEKLNHRDHRQKVGLYPFLQVVETLFAEAGFPKVKGHLQHSGIKPRLDIHIAHEDLGLPPGYHATPDEPLNGIFTERVPGQPEAAHTFENQLHAYAESRGANEIREVFEADANLRNLILYASEGGIPVATDVDPALIIRRRSVVTLLTLTIAIMQTKAHQLLAVQCLEAYLRALERLPPALFDFDKALAPPTGLIIEVSLTGDSTPEAKAYRRIDFSAAAIDVNFRVSRG